MAVSSVVPNPNPPQRGRRVVFTINHDTDAPSFSLDDVMFSVFNPGQTPFSDDDLTLVRIDNRTYTLAVDLPDTTNFILIQIFGVNHLFRNVEDPPPAPIPTITFEGSDGNAITSGFAGQLVTAVISWSQAFTGTFGTGQVTVAGGAKDSFSGSGENYRQSVRLPSRTDGTLTVSIAADIVANSDGTNNLAGSATLPYSRPTPTVTFRNSTGLAGVDTVADVVFNAPVGAIDASSDFQVTNGSFVSITTTTIGLSYAVTVRPNAGTDGTLTLAILENRATDGNLAASDTLSFSRQSLVLSFDDAVLISGIETSLTLTSNAPISGLFAFEIEVTGAGGLNYSVDGNTADIVLTPTRLMDGTVVVRIPENALANGNREVVAQKSFARPRPTITLSESDTGNSQEVTATVRWNIAPDRDDFIGADIVLSAGTKGAFSGDELEFFQVFTTPASGGGTLTVSIPENSIYEGNPAASASLTYTPIPVPTITFSQPNPISGRELNAVIRVSRDITNLLESDFDVTGGTRGNLIRVNARLWELRVTPDYRTDGTLQVDLAENVVPEGNLAATASIGYLRPRFTIGFDVVRLFLGATTDARIQCNVPTTFFHTEDVTVTGGTKGSFTATDDSNYSVGITSPATGSGEIVVSIPENAIPEGNPPVEARITYADVIRTTLSFDTTVAIHSTVFHALIGFSAPVSSVPVARIGVTGATKGAISGSGQSWRLAITPPASGSGTIRVNIPEDIVPEGNLGVEATILYAGSTLPPEIERVGKQRIIVNTPFILMIVIRNVPDDVLVLGLQEGFHHNIISGGVQIIGTPKRLVSGDLWNVFASNIHSPRDIEGNIIPATLDVEYEVVPPAPVISDVNPQTVRRGVAFDLTIPIANKGATTVEGLITGLRFEEVENGVRIYGTVPTDAVFTETSGDWVVTSKNAGGTDIANVDWSFA